NVDDVYGSPDTLMHRDRPVLHVANLSHTPVSIGEGQALGTAHRPEHWLDKNHAYGAGQLQRMEAHAHMVRQLVVSQTTPREVTGHAIQAEAVDLPLDSVRLTSEDPLAEEPLEGGPKTSEAPPEETSFNAFVRDIDISEELDPGRRADFLQMLIRNQAAFSLDGRLGTIKGSVCTIPLRPGAKEVSLPPFPGSPAKREVM
ncbi:hypothetical protein BV20DRAFT_928842, partial [Pilatotrama ljubarskyi]